MVQRPTAMNVWSRTRVCLPDTSLSTKLRNFRVWCPYPNRPKATYVRQTAREPTAALKGGVLEENLHIYGQTPASTWIVLTASALLAVNGQVCSPPAHRLIAGVPAAFHENKVQCPRESSGQRNGGSVARKRYQQGSLILRGTRVKKWYDRWLEDELQPDGSVIRLHRSEILGDKSEFPTKRLAQRELDRRLAAINSPISGARRPTHNHGLHARDWGRSQESGRATRGILCPSSP